MRIQRVSIEMIRRIIETRDPIGLFYALKSGVYIAVDNSTGDAWTEEFTTYRGCERWLLNPGLCKEDTEDE